MKNHEKITVLKWNEMLWGNKLLAEQVFTSDVNKAGPNRSEDNTGDEDKSSDQQEGNKIKHHQESQEQEVWLDTTSKVSCRGKGPHFIKTDKYIQTIYVK